MAKNLGDCGRREFNMEKEFMLQLMVELREDYGKKAS